MPRKALIFTIAVAIAAALAAGCGGSGGAGDTAGSSAAAGGGESREEVGAGKSSTTPEPDRKQAEAGGGSSATPSRPGAPEAVKPETATPEAAKPEAPARGGKQSERGQGQAQGSPAPAKAAFIKQANRICAQDRKTREKAAGVYSRSGGAKGSAKERVVGLIRGIYIPAFEEQVAHLRGLAAPAGEGSELEELERALEDWVRAMHRVKGLKPSPAANKASLRAATLAKRYDLDECSPAVQGGSQ